MLKNKKLQKLTSEKDLISEQAFSINNDKINKRLDQFSYKNIKNAVNQTNYRE